MTSLLLGLGLGLLTAICFGVADFLAAIVARRVGSLRTAIGGAATGAFFLSAAIPWAGAGISMPSAWIVTALVVTGLVQAGGYVSFYRGLATGAVSIVTPIVAAWAIIPVLVGLLIFDEKLLAVQALGIAFTIVGVVLVSTSAEKPNGKNPTTVAPAIVYGFGALLGFGVSITMLAPLGREVGWFLPILVARVVSLVVLLSFASIPRQSGAWQAKFWHVPALIVANIAGIGLLDAIGYIAYAVGVRLEDVSLVATASSISPVFTIALACIFFAERLGRVQAVGVGGVIVGVVLIAT